MAEVEEGLYPLHVAVENETEKVIAALIAAGATLDVMDKNGNTPLHVAATKSIVVIQVREREREREREGEGATFLISFYTSFLLVEKPLPKNGYSINSQ